MPYVILRVLKASLVSHNYTMNRMYISTERCIDILLFQIHGCAPHRIHQKYSQPELGSFRNLSADFM